MQRAQWPAAFDELMTIRGRGAAIPGEVGLEGSDPLYRSPFRVCETAAAVLAAFGTLVALGRRAREGGSYRVQVSLCQSAMLYQRQGLLADSEEGQTASPRRRRTGCDRRDLGLRGPAHARPGAADVPDALSVGPSDAPARGPSVGIGAAGLIVRARGARDREDGLRNCARQDRGRK